MSVTSSLETEIQDVLKELNKMEVGSEQYERTVDSVKLLIEKKIELERLEMETQNKITDREVETELKLMEIKIDKRDRWIKNGLTALSVIGGLGLAVWGTLATFKYEEEGTVTSLIGKGHINKLLPNFPKRQ